MSSQGVLQKMEQVLRANPLTFTATTLTKEVYGDRANGHYNYVTKNIREQEELGALTRNEEGLIQVLSGTLMWPGRIKKLSKTNPTNNKLTINPLKLPAYLSNKEDLQKAFNNNKYLADLLATVKKDPLALKNELILLANDYPEIRNLAPLFIELVCYMQIILGTPENPCRFFEPLEIPSSGETQESIDIFKRLLALVRMV